jgi:phosphatidylglycerol lysyltransferase
MMNSMTPKGLQKARRLVDKYGQNPTSYLTLETDKQLFFGKEVEGVIAYGIVGKVIVICGDPICASEDFLKLIGEFKLFCVEHSCRCQWLFLGTTSHFIKEYTMLGFNHVPYGEEGRFELACYHLEGSSMRRMRDQINHADKFGLTTYEYHYTKDRDLALENEFHSISEQWLEGKKSTSLGFTLGSISLNNPMDRRYFYAKDSRGRVMAFHVYTPFDGFTGYTAAITRRLTDAPRGVTEKINYDAFMTFKNEGIKWGSIGLAPLANLMKEGIKHDFNVKFLNIIYEKGNRFYGFKSLHQAKRKYRPTFWLPQYLVYSTRNITPQILFAIVKIQSPKGVREFLRKPLLNIL